MYIPHTYTPYTPTHIYIYIHTVHTAPTYTHHTHTCIHIHVHAIHTTHTDTHTYHTHTDQWDTIESPEINLHILVN